MAHLRLEPGGRCKTLAAYQTQPSMGAAVQAAIGPREGFNPPGLEPQHPTFFLPENRGRRAHREEAVHARIVAAPTSQPRVAPQGREEEARAAPSDAAGREARGRAARRRARARLPELAQAQGARR